MTSHPPHPNIEQQGSPAAHNGGETQTTTELHPKRRFASYPSPEPRRLDFSPAGTEPDDDDDNSWFARWVGRNKNVNPLEHFNFENSNVATHPVEDTSRHTKKHKLVHDRDDNKSKEDSNSSPGFSVCGIESSQIDQCSPSSCVSNRSESNTTMSTLEGTVSDDLLPEDTRRKRRNHENQMHCLDLDDFLKDSDCPAIPKKNFADLVKQISCDFNKGTEVHMAQGVVSTMHAVSESHLVDFLFATEQACKNAKRKRPTTRDIELVNRIRDKLQP